ncbi:MAG: nuclear transport factor 2 family protein [Candidatus Hodarchaeales archaeon]
MNNNFSNTSITIKDFLNKEMFDLLNTQNLENFGNFFSEQILFKNPDLEKPIVEIKDFLKWWEEIFVIWENAKWKLINLEEINKNSFKCSYTFTGTHFITQMTVKIDIQAKIKAENGKIIEFENVFDSDDFIKQAGF